MTVPTSTCQINVTFARYFYPTNTDPAALTDHSVADVDGQWRRQLPKYGHDVG